ncbi:MAG: tRNA (adenosine(37)-N6)-threonylcarbamoyltransferase complex dimerization subunit type 1 TsaB [Firmicutes bacterium]|nr:tRNA (adenosine(37)-N6)-threonylcarbamoyltransferase complex dimerization subunit type 1 TsaB [Bacillota bacterium]
MSKLLAVDTSTSSLSLAVAGPEGVCGEFALYNGETHSRSLLPMADALLSLSGIQLTDLSALAVTLGPGSFTGLRIGLATVKAWAFALDLPVAGVSATQAMAWAATADSDVYSCPIFDARRDEVYAALFQGGQRLWPDDGVNPQLLAMRLKQLKAPVVFSGDGLAKYRDCLREILGDHYREAPGDRRRFMAAAVATLGYEKFRRGEFIDIVGQEPEYLRGADIDQHQPHAH